MEWQLLSDIYPANLIILIIIQYDYTLEFGFEINGIWISKKLSEVIWLKFRYSDESLIKFY